MKTPHPKNRDVPRSCKPAKAPGFARQFGIIVICPTEAEQRIAYDGLRALGLARLKPVAV